MISLCLIYSISNEILSEEANLCMYDLCMYVSMYGDDRRDETYIVKLEFDCY